MACFASATTKASRAPLLSNAPPARTLPGLTGPGHAVTEAGSGLEALEMLRKNEPGTFSLILTVRPRRACWELGSLVAEPLAGVGLAGGTGPGGGVDL